LRRLISWLPPLVYMAVIFAVSAQPNPFPEVTARVSDKVLHLVEYSVLARCSCGRSRAKVWAGATRAGGDRDDEPVRRERRVSPGVRAQPQSRRSAIGWPIPSAPSVRRVGLPARYIRSRRLIFSTERRALHVEQLGRLPLVAARALERR
jgi:hypothetical protein